MSQRTLLQRTRIAHRVSNALARPFVRIWVRTSEMSDPRLPRPQSPDRREPPAHNDDRVLLVGNGATVGYGVLSHELSLAGHLGRQISQFTGRATHVTVIADGAMTAATAEPALRAVDLDPYDAVVFTVGVNEALSLSSGTRWQRDLDALLGAMRERMPRLRVCMVAIPPVKSISAAPASVQWFTNRHARVLNEILAATCSRFSRVTYLPFAPGTSRDVGRYRSSETYREWSGMLSAEIAHWLAADCAEDDGATPDKHAAR